MKAMKIFIWRHSNLFSSWSMHDEPKIYHERYASAEVAVLASAMDEALEILAASDKWDIDEIRKIEPVVIECSEPGIITSHVTF